MIESIYVELTNICNFHCKHCYNASGDGGSSQHIDYGILKKIASGKYDNKLKMISLSGGETLLYPYLKEAIQEFSDYGWKVSLVTNGVLLKEEILYFLDKNNVSIQVSVDGPEDVHDLIRGKGNFKRVCEKIKLVKKIYDDHEFIIKAVLTKKLLGRIEEYVVSMLSLGAARVEFGMMSYSGRARDKFYEDYAPNGQELIKLDQEISRIARKYSGYVGKLQVCYSCGMLYRTNSVYNLRVDSNGNVFLCQGFIEKQYSVGNLKECIFDEILHGEKTQMLLQIMKNRQNNYLCGDCLLKEYEKCWKGCPAEEMNRNGIKIGLDGSCDLRKFKYIYELIQQGKES